MRLDDRPTEIAWATQSMWAPPVTWGVAEIADAGNHVNYTGAWASAWARGNRVGPAKCVFPWPRGPPPSVGPTEVGTRRVVGPAAGPGKLVDPERGGSRVGPRRGSRVDGRGPLPSLPSPLDPTTGAIPRGPHRSRWAPRGASRGPCGRRGPAEEIRVGYPVRVGPRGENPVGRRKSAWAPRGKLVGPPIRVGPHRGKSVGPAGKTRGFTENHVGPESWALTEIRVGPTPGVGPHRVSRGPRKSA